MVLSNYLRSGVSQSPAYPHTLSRLSLVRICCVQNSMALQHLTKTSKFTIERLIQIAKISTSEVCARKAKEAKDNLHFITLGDGPHVVALLPGLFGSIQSDYQMILPKLNQTDFTWVSWDPPGYGKSQPPKRDFSGDFLRRDAHTFVRLMDILDYDKFSAVGWSMGGMTGALIAIDFPERVKKLVMWGSHSRADEQSVKFGDSIRTIGGWSPHMSQALVAAHGSEKYVEEMSNAWADANQKSLETFGNGQSAYEHLYKGIPRINAPTLILYGEKDPMMPIVHAHYYHHKIKNSLFYLWPNGKHNLHMTHSNKFLKILEYFLLTGELEKVTEGN